MTGRIDTPHGDFPLRFATRRLELHEAFDRVATVVLEEDLRSLDLDADVTTTPIVAESTFARAGLYAKQDGVLCGLGALSITYDKLDARVMVTVVCSDGDDVAAGDELARIEGPARAILVGERAALNVIGHLSGVATMVRRFVREAKGTTLTDTRKTLPGLRLLEKYAVRVGGGSNHRFGLWDGVLIKDNHIVAAGGVGEAVRRARAHSALPVQAECTCEREVDEALDAGAHAILLDNQTPDELERLTKHIKARADHVLVEASGGVTLDNVGRIAATGVDRISIGAFTHSAPALDISMKLERVWNDG